MTKSIIVSYDDTHGRDATVLLVGDKKPGEIVNIINAYQGVEAEELWKKLTVKKGEKHEKDIYN